MAWATPALVATRWLRSPPYPVTTTRCIWMRNTPLPLDIIFVGPDSQVVSIARRTTPYSEESIRPAAPKKYVVEIRAGMADRLSITDSTRSRVVPLTELRLLSTAETVAFDTPASRAATRSARSAMFSVPVIP